MIYFQRGNTETLIGYDEHFFCQRVKMMNRKKRIATCRDVGNREQRGWSALDCPNKLRFAFCNNVAKIRFHIKGWIRFMSHHSRFRTTFFAAVLVAETQAPEYSLLRVLLLLPNLTLPSQLQNHFISSLLSLLCLLRFAYRSAFYNFPFSLLLLSRAEPQFFSSFPAIPLSLTRFNFSGFLLLSFAPYLVLKKKK